MGVWSAQRAAGPIYSAQAEGAGGLALGFPAPAGMTTVSRKVAGRRGQVRSIQHGQNEVRPAPAWEAENGAWTLRSYAMKSIRRDWVKAKPKAALPKELRPHLMGLSNLSSLRTNER